MTSILRAGLDALTKLLGAEPHQQDVVFSEASARAALAGPMTRRGLFRAAGAVAAGTLFADVALAPIPSCEAFLTAKAAETESLYHTSAEAFNAFLKERWSDSILERLMFPDAPLLSLVTKLPTLGPELPILVHS